ncbi:MAG: sulfurtransferase TusA family protein [Geobacter sp.]|nr:sulfurtransferase TusA family protein [Geobacter sp.]
MNTIDLRGVCCPTNFVKAKLALEQIAPGEEIILLLEDGEALKNIPRSLKAEGHRLLGLRESEGHYELSILKGTDEEG